MSSGDPQHKRSRVLGLPPIRGNARLLLLYVVLNSAALSAVGSLVAPYLRGAGFAPAQIGLFFSIQAAAQAIAAFSGGFLADALGHRRIWLWGKLMHVAAFLVLGLGLKGKALLAAAILTGCSQIPIGVMSAVTAAATQPAWRATFFAVRGTLESIAATVAPLAGGLVADRWGAPVAFLGAMPLFTLVLLIIWRLDYSTVAVARRSAEAAPGGVRRLRAGLARLAEGIVKGPHPRTAMVVLALQVLNGLSNGLLNVGIPLLMQDRFGSGYAGISGISAVTALGTALTLIVGGRVADRHGRRRVILFSFAAALALFVPILWASSSAQFYVLFFLICLVGNAGGGAYSAMAMECVREDIRATYGGVIQGLFSLGFAAGSVLSGAIYARSALAPVHGVIAINVAYLLLGFLLEETGPRARGGAAPLR